MRNPLSVNRLAWELVKRLLKNADYYGVGVRKTSLGATIIDGGVKTKAGFRTGMLVTEICMGGCAHTSLNMRRFGELELPSISVFSDHPIIATLGSQYAGWQISEEGYFAIGSGPARALAQKPKAIFDEIDYHDDFDRAVMVLETDEPPPTKIIERFVRDCKVSPENLAIILTPTTSIVGATQISGRIVETGVHKLRKIGLDPRVILHAWGCAPIPPIHPKFEHAMGRTNDAILYGGTAYYTVMHDEDDELCAMVSKAPSKVSKDYGKPFLEIFKEVRYDFYKIDPDLFAPAAITVNNVKTGSTFTSGEINVEALSQSFGFSSRS